MRHAALLFPLSFAVAACGAPRTAHDAVSGQAGVIQAPGVPVTSIEIVDGWAGLGKPVSARYVIRRDAEGFVLTGSFAEGDAVFDDGNPVHPIGPMRSDSEGVESLGRVLRAPPLVRDAGLALLLDADAVREQADAQYERLQYGEQACSAVAREMFHSALLDPETARDVLEETYSRFHTDDNPGVSLAVIYADGSRRAATSNAQAAFMMPWRVDGTETWNPDLARALAEVLPLDAPNRRRLAGEDWLEDFADEAMDSIEDGWHEAEGRCRHRALLTSLAQAGYATVAVPMAGPHAVNVTLRRADFPANLVVYAIFFGESQAAELAAFRRRIDTYANRAVPFAKANPDRRFELQFYRTQSLTDVAILAGNLRIRPGEIGDVVLIEDADVLNSPPGWALMPDGRIEHWD